MGRGIVYFSLFGLIFIDVCLVWKIDFMIIFYRGVFLWFFRFLGLWVSIYVWLYVGLENVKKDDFMCWIRSSRVCFGRLLIVFFGACFGFL